MKSATTPTSPRTSAQLDLAASCIASSAARRAGRRGRCSTEQLAASRRGHEQPARDDLRELITAGTSCTAWNRPGEGRRAETQRVQPSIASSTATRITRPIGPATSMPHTLVTAKPTTTSACTDASTANAIAYLTTRAGAMIGSVMSRPSVPDVRSRSVATLVTRNSHEQREQPDEQCPNEPRTGARLEHPRDARVEEAWSATRTSAIVRSWRSQEDAVPGGAVAAVRRGAHDDFEPASAVARRPARPACRPAPATAWAGRRRRAASSPRSTS